MTKQMKITVLAAAALLLVATAGVSWAQRTRLSRTSTALPTRTSFDPYTLQTRTTSRTSLRSTTTRTASVTTVVEPTALPPRSPFLPPRRPFPPPSLR